MKERAVLRSGKFLGFISIFLLAALPVRADSPEAIVQSVLQSWQSVDRHIPGSVLRSEAEAHIPSDVLKRLISLEQTQVVAGLRTLSQRVGITKGIAENLLKIHQIFRRTSIVLPPFADHREDEIAELRKEELEPLMEGFSDESARVLLPSKNFFSFNEYKFIEFAVRNILNNDDYAFSTAGLLYTMGLHEEIEATFELTTRGNAAHPYQVAFGQDVLIAILKHLHFKRWQVEAVRARADKKFEISPDYYDKWLMNWKFQGRMTGLRSGTLVFPDEPVLEITGDPATLILIESIVNPVIGTLTNLATASARLHEAAGGVPIDEGATRRSLLSEFVAYAAAHTGSARTSNVAISDLLKMDAYGTMQHSLIAMLVSIYGDEEKAVEAIFDRAKMPLIALPDTHDTPSGLRAAIRAGGDLVLGARVDSAMRDPDTGRNLSTMQTLHRFNEILTLLGRPNRPAIVTNDLTETSMAELARQKELPIGRFSAGGAFLGTGHANLVYKITSLRDKKTGEVYYPIKIAASGKSTRPAEKNVYRRRLASTRIWNGDQVVSAQEAAPTPREGEELELQTSVLLDSTDPDFVLPPRMTPSESLAFVTTQVESLPPALRDLKATRESLLTSGQPYLVSYSAALNRIREAAVHAVTPPQEHRILVFPGSFYPFVPTGHGRVLDAVTEVYKDVSNPTGFDKTIILPTGENPAHGRTYGLSEQARRDLIAFRMRGRSDVEVWETELFDPGVQHRTIDSLNAIRSRFPHSRIVVAMGGDTFWSIGRKNAQWYRARELLESFDFAVLSGRDPMGNDRAETEALLTDFEKHRLRYVSPKGSQIRLLELGRQEISGSAVRDFYDSLPYYAVLHVTDPQWTFLDRTELPGKTQKEKGSLAVPHATESIGRVVQVAQVARDLSRYKVSLSNDAHYSIEVKDPTQNGEFHGQFNFPPHGMKGVLGPEGDSLIEELDDVIPLSVQRVIPSNHEVENRLVPVPFDMGQFNDSEIRDPNAVFRFEKNGVGSYSVFSNPHYEKYLERIDPYRVLPHFEDGWCLDFCTYHAVMGKLQRGYRVYLVIDAAAGAFNVLTGVRLKEVLALGVEVMTTEEFVTLNRSWNQQTRWEQVLNDLAEWKKTTRTRSWLERELAKPVYRGTGPADSGALCGVNLQPPTPYAKVFDSPPSKK